jgi:hypothetical protein
MNVGKATAGLLLLSALMLCAMAVQATMAAAQVSENTTAFTCVKGGGALDFKDAHCDVTTTPGKGEFGHVLISEGKTEIEVTNKETANATKEAAIFTLKSFLAGSKTHTDCNTATGTGTIENSTTTGKNHRVSGTLNLNVTNCTVTEPANCKVKEPIVWEVNFTGVDGLNGAEGNMGLEFVPPAGKNFTEITFEGEKCGLKGLTFGVSGSAIGTGGAGGNAKEGGATWNFSPEKEMQKLIWGGQPDEFNASLTVRMKGGGNPISLTTVT